MTSKRFGLVTSAAVVIAAIVLVIKVMDVNAQTTPGKSPSRFGTAQNNPAGQEQTLKGRVVDLHTFMTGQAESADMDEAVTECIRSGVPAALETSEGLYVLGQGSKGPARSLAEFANKNVQIKGRLFEKGGLRYLDMTTINETNGEGDYPEDK